MTRYVVRRVAWALALLAGVSLLTFVIFYLLPSAEPAALRAGKAPSPALIAHVRHSLGLDEPWYEQYLHYMGRLVLHFDLGYSYQNDVPVRTALSERLPATLSLAAGAAVVWLLLGIAAGTVSAVKRHSWLDRVAMGAALAGISAPVYWVALLVLFLFASDVGKLHVLPGAGSYVPLTQSPVAWLGSLALPWLVLGCSFAAVYARLLRASLSSALAEGHIRMARATGFSERRVVLRHAMRSAITPVLSAAGVDLGMLLGGAILTETAFNIPGIGRLAYEAVLAGDLPTIQGTVLVSAFFIVAANLLVDLLYAYLDPRVRYA